MRITGLPTPLQPDGDAIRQVAEKFPGWPCRRCLRDAQPGDVMLLLSYDPWTTNSPYRQSGPIFVHERDCEPWSDTGLPDQLTSRLLSVRSIDREGTQIAADVIPGTDLEDKLNDEFANENTAYVHVHNAKPGCFAARVDRAR